MTTQTEVLKLALEALEKHGEAPKDWACKECVPFSDILKDGFKCKYHAAITAIKAALEAHKALAQPEQEPVAWVNWCAATGKRSVSFECESELASQPLYTKEQS